MGLACVAGGIARSGGLWMGEVVTDLGSAVDGGDGTGAGGALPSGALMVCGIGLCCGDGGRVSSELPGVPSTRRGIDVGYAPTFPACRWRQVPAIE